MKYNEKYDRYIDDDLVIYKWSKGKNKLVQCKQTINNQGYKVIQTKIGLCLAHRVIWETFKSEIPEGYQIDHINTIRTDNRLENLRVVTCKENHNNPLTKKHKSEIKKGHVVTEETKRKMSESHKGKNCSYFGRKFQEHFDLTSTDDAKLYHRELCWYLKHNKTCRWENV